MTTLVTADIDHDGDFDLAAAVDADDVILWWENRLDDSGSWTQRVVHSFTSTVLFPGIAAVDLDGDGDTDIASLDLNQDLNWFENLMGDGSTWAEHEIDSDRGSTSLVGGDIDGDGDADLVANQAALTPITWYENLSGDGSTWESHELSSEGPSSEWIELTDLDGDGDLDILAAVDSVDVDVDDSIRWWENLSGDGSLWSEHEIGADFLGASSATSVDLDRDGDLDVIATARESNLVAWWENLAGDGESWLGRQITNGTGGAERVVAADFDGDTDADAIVIAFLESEIELLSNRYPPRCRPDEYEPGDLVGLTALPDPGWEIDGWFGTVDDLSVDDQNAVLMTAAAALAGVDYVPTGGGDPTLVVTGSCPGRIEIELDGATPSQGVALLGSSALGGSSVPVGGCAGTPLELGMPGLLAILPADAEGKLELTRQVAENLCGLHLQALDLSTCTTTNVATIGERGERSIGLSTGPSGR